MLKPVGSTPGWAMETYVDTDGSIHVAENGTWLIYSAAVGSVTTGYHHLAYVRSGTGFAVYVNGVRVTDNISSAHLAAYAAVAYSLWLGYCLNGAIDQFRITHGKPRYTANFTPQTLVPDEDTPPMWTFDGSAGQKWVKELSKNTAMIAATNARVVKDGVWIAPASTSPTINASTYKFGTGSMYFDGTKYLSIPDGAIPELGSQNFVSTVG